MPAEAANFAMAAIQKTRAEVLAAPLAKRERATAARPRPAGRLPGRLNLFQVAMLGWRDLHPYNAVHAARIASPLDRDALERTIRETLTSAGLTGLELDRRRHRYAWRGGPSRIGVDVVQAGDDWRAALTRLFERELNAPFARDGAFEPFRFFALDLGDSFFLGLAYDHFIAGGDSIVALLSAMADRYGGGAPADDDPLARYPHTHGRLFLRHPLAFCRSLARLPAMGASCRRTIRPRYRPLEEGHNAFRFFTLDADRYAALRATARSFCVTLNDVLIAIMLLVQDATSPARDGSARRSELAVASIMNLRDAHGAHARGTFGQFLSSFRVSHPMPPGIALRDLAQDVHRTTARIKRERLYLATLSAVAVDRVIGRFQTPKQRMSVYAKSYPVGAGLSSLNVDALWHPDGSGRAPWYVRGVPTGPTTPLAVAVTTANGELCAGLSYRTAAFTADAIAKIENDIRRRIDALQ
jgi:hypothetical protein